MRRLLSHRGLFSKCKLLMEITIEYQPILEAPAASGVKSISLRQLCKTNPICWMLKWTQPLSIQRIMKTSDFADVWKQTQYKPNTKPIQTQYKPKQTQFFQRPKWTQMLFHKRIMKINRVLTPPKQTQFKPNQTQSCPERSRGISSFYEAKKSPKKPVFFLNPDNFSSEFCQFDWFSACSFFSSKAFRISSSLVGYSCGASSNVHS